MARKGTPAWQIMGLPEQPPADAHGYVSYGTVWHPAMPSRREPLAEHLRLCLWSVAYWGKKVRRDIHWTRQQGLQGGLGARALDRVALALVWMVTTLHDRVSTTPGR